MRPSSAPAKRISGTACGISTAISTAASATHITTAVRTVALAASRRSSPRLRATTAVTPILSAKNMLSMIILGWPTRPTAATASVPMPLTITVSIMLISEISTISHTDGTARRIYSR